MEISEWKPVHIPEYSFYEISTRGDIRNTKSNYIIATHIRNGYEACCLYSPQTKKKHTYNVHILMKYTFFEGDDMEKLINHKDGNKTNNNLDNLELVTAKENVQHAFRTGLIVHYTRPVRQCTMNGEFIEEFKSAKEAEEKTGVNSKHIPSVCNGRRTSAGGFIWKYENTTVPFDQSELKIIEGYPSYGISSSGDIYNIKTHKKLVQKIMASGYHIIKLSNNGKVKDFYVHVLKKKYFGGEDLNPKVISKDLTGAQ